MVTRTESIKKFLEVKTHRDLFEYYSKDMEVQVNVAQDQGSPVEGEYQGRQWRGWSDGLTTWKSFRIPINAKTEPIFHDPQITFDLAEHVEGIGMTGWNFTEKKSIYVAFDFDSILNHQKGLSQEELNQIVDIVKEIPWVQVRKSTSGKGYHFYIYLKNSPLIGNHNEHAALARAILGKLSILTNYDFSTKVDNCGGNMWIWHRKMLGTDGLVVIKPQIELFEDIPDNWQEHLRVIKGGKSKTLPTFIEEKGNGDLFLELSGQRTPVPLDEDHKKLINFLQGFSSWDNDHKMLVTHTYHLLKAHQELNLKGIFKTNATGKNAPTDRNCYLFPLRKGAWVVRRFTQGCIEDPSWETDSSGWTRCFYNKEPTLEVVAKTFEGIERPSGGYLFNTAEQAQLAANTLNANLNLPNSLLQRQTILRKHKDNRLIVEVEYEAKDFDDRLRDWMVENGKWKKIFDIRLGEKETDDVGINVDDTVRHLVTFDGEDYGWAIKSDGSWIIEPLSHVKPTLSACGLKANQINIILGKCVLSKWTIINEPFKEEFPGERLWNRSNVRLRFNPNQNLDTLNFPTWNNILNHVGANLDYSVSLNPWCKENGLIKGIDYLKVWIASLFQRPKQPLPYLFLYGEQDCGKSTLHEAISLLLIGGFVRADTALISPSGFNGELENAILCVVEETELSRKGGQVYNRIKDWVTAKYLNIHKKGMTPYLNVNCTHWIQTANDYKACPIFPGDTRITMINVPQLKDRINREELTRRLEEEAPDFLASILSIELPRSQERLGVPVIVTQEKVQAEKLTQSSLEIFLKENCHYYPGKVILIKDFYEKFLAYLDPGERVEWTKQRIGKELPLTFVKGRLKTDGHWYYGNISFEAPDRIDKPKYILVGDYLVLEK